MLPSLLHTSIPHHGLMEFFDTKKNWGEESVKTGVLYLYYLYYLYIFVGGWVQIGMQHFHQVLLSALLENLRK